MPRGGARVGAGRRAGTGKAKDAAPAQAGESVSFGPTDETPLDYMLRLMRDPNVEESRRDRLAVAAAPYVHAKVGEAGKKEKDKDRAVDAASGRYAALATPRLVHSKA